MKIDWCLWVPWSSGGNLKIYGRGLVSLGFLGFLVEWLVSLWFFGEGSFVLWGKDCCPEGRGGEGVLYWGICDEVILSALSALVDIILAGDRGEPEWVALIAHYTQTSPVLVTRWTQIPMWRDKLRIPITLSFPPSSNTTFERAKGGGEGGCHT